MQNLISPLIFFSLKKLGISFLISVILITISIKFNKKEFVGFVHFTIVKPSNIDNSLSSLSSIISNNSAAKPFEENYIVEHLESKLLIAGFLGKYDLNSKALDIDSLVEYNSAFKKFTAAVSVKKENKVTPLLTLKIQSTDRNLVELFHKNYLDYCDSIIISEYKFRNISLNDWISTKADSTRRGLYTSVRRLAELNQYFIGQDVFSGNSLRVQQDNLLADLKIFQESYPQLVKTAMTMSLMDVPPKSFFFIQRKSKIFEKPTSLVNIFLKFFGLLLMSMLLINAKNFKKILWRN